MRPEPKILILEHPENRNTLTSLLESIGVEVVRVADGATATETTGQDRFSIAVLTGRVSVTEAGKLAEIFRSQEKNKNLSTIYVTGNDTVDFDSLDESAHGHPYFLLKPNYPDMLLRDVAHFVKLDQQQLELEDLRKRSLEECEELKARLKKNEDQVELLAMLSWIISDAQDLQSALELTMKQVCRITGWCMGEAWVQNVNESALKRCSVWSRDHPGLETFISQSSDLQFEMGVGLPGRAWSIRNPLWIKDLEADESFSRKSSAREAGLKTAMVFPILSEKEVPAVFSFFDFESALVNPDIIGIVATVTAQLGNLLRWKMTRESLGRVQSGIREQAALLDKTQDAIIQEDLEERIIFWNRGAERLYGWTSQEAVGVRFEQLSTRDRSPVLRIARQSAMENGHWSGELAQRGKDEKTLIVHSRLTLIRDDEGALTSLLFVNTDVSDKKRIEEKLQKIDRMKTLGSLAGGIAHDLNNALAPILMATERLKERLSTSEDRNYLQIIGNNLDRAINVTNQFLTFSRDRKGKKMTLNPKHLISDLLKVIQESFSKSIIVKSHIVKDFRYLNGDDAQIHQVLLNCCLNAQEAMPGGGGLLLSIENIMVDENFEFSSPEAIPGPYLVIEIRDEGCGIPSEHLEEIFDPFFTTKENENGIGLGLSSSLGIIRNHGGFLNVQSEVNKGTSIRIYLPALKNRVIPTLPEEGKMPHGEGELVLVVEDEDDIREMLGEILISSGYKVLLAVDGTEAVKLYAENPAEIKLVITDIMMPQMDGMILTRTLKKLNPDLDMIISTAFEGGKLSEKKFDELDRMDVKTILKKPYHNSELLIAVDRLLHHSRSTCLEVDT